MPLDSPRSALFRSFLTCDNPKDVVECGIAIRKSKAGCKKSEDKVKSPIVPKNFNTSSAYKEEGKEMVSTEIAKDLLKGALDLQESLAMLGKLQEASQHMAELKKKQKVKSRAERVGEMEIERTNSHHFTDHNYQTEFRKLRLSDDGSSRDCFVEQEASECMAKLKKKQEKSIGEKIGEMGIGKMNSHHFQNHNNQKGFQNRRISANDCSSRDSFEELKTGIRDSLARQNLLSPGYNERKTCCDKRTIDSAVDMDSTSSSQSSTANFHSFSSSGSSASSRPPQKSKRSNLIAKLMGLEEIPSQSVHFGSDMFSNQRRPMFELDKLQARKVQFAACEVDAEPRKLKEIVETMQYKGLLKNSSEEFGPQFYRTNSSNSKQRSPEDAPPIVIIKPVCLSSGDGEESHLQRFIRDVRALDNQGELGNLKTNELQPQTMNHSEGSKNSEEMYKRGEEDLSKEVEAKPEETALVKTNGKLSKLKVSVPVNQQQKREAVEKKVDRIEKVKTYRRKPAEMENVKSKSVCKSYCQAKVTSTKERKPEIRSDIKKALGSQQISTSSSPISKSTLQGISHSNGEQRKSFKNKKPAKYPQKTNLIVEKIGCNSSDLTRETDFDMTRTSSTITDQILIQGGMDAPEIQIIDECEGNRTFPCNISSFHKYAEELFDINTNKAIVLGKTSLNDPGKTDSRIFLDSTNELMQHKILGRTIATRPFLLTPARNSKIAISQAQLMEEVCTGIENLSSYNQYAGGKFFANKEVRGRWDLDWRYGFTVDEVERVASDVEKIVFSGLIEEMFTDFVL